MSSFFRRGYLPLVCVIFILCLSYLVFSQAPPPPCPPDVAGCNASNAIYYYSNQSSNQTYAPENLSMPPEQSSAQGCKENSDCYSGNCDLDTGYCISCYDLIRNGDESDIDCGGSCAPCADNMKCHNSSDCLSKNCLSRKCLSLCNDQVMNGDETDVDCGGSCPPCSSVEPPQDTTQDNGDNLGNAGSVDQGFAAKTSLPIVQKPAVNLENPPAPSSDIYLIYFSLLMIVVIGFLTIFNTIQISRMRKGTSPLIKQVISKPSRPVEPKKEVDQDSSVLNSFVKTCHEKNLDKDAVRKSLIEKGWDSSSVDNSIDEIYS